MSFQAKTIFGILTVVLVVSATILGFVGISLAQYNYYNYGNCNYHAYRDCVGSSIYWFDSCSTRQDLYQDCASLGQTCQYGQCVVEIQPVYIAHQKISCYANNLYWYDSLGAVNSLYKNCQDANSCTTNSCSGVKCSNILKCDGTTCLTDSADYNSYCASVSNCGNGTCEENLGETSANCPGDCKTNNPNNNPTNLSVSFVGKQDAASQQWDKNVQVQQNSTVYFMIAVNNNSDVAADNVNVSVNIPAEISLLGNLKINDVSVAGDIASGINLGSVSPKTSKSVTFEGKTQAFSIQEQKQATTTISAGGSNQSDFVDLSFNPSQSAVAGVSSTTDNSGFMDFLKRWYLWILAAIVLVFLFIIVFRRFSSGA